MSRGVSYTKHLDLTQTKEIYEQSVENWDFLYKASTTKDSRFDIGDRVCLPDGRVFRYSKSGALCKAGHGAAFMNTAAVLTHALAAGQAIGDKSIQIASQTFTLDQLRGGYATIFAEDNDNQINVQHRGIVGNTAASGTTVTIYLDAPLVRAVTVSMNVLVTHNPYSNMQTQVGQEFGYASIGGVPAAYVDAANKYFWLQTWGACWCVATEHLGDAQGEAQYVFTAEGALRVEATTNDGSHKQLTAQHAGFPIPCGAAGLGWNEQIIMLQISP